MQQVGVIRITRPPGNDQCPDQESSFRSERLMSKMDFFGPRVRTIATAASGSAISIILVRSATGQ